MDKPELVQINILRQLLQDNTYKIDYETIGKYNSYNNTYYDFIPGTIPDKKYECYKAMIDFFSLGVGVFTTETDICEILQKLFTHPTERLTGNMADNQLVASYIVLDFTVFCMRWVQSVFISQNVEEAVKNEKLEEIKSGLDGFDNGYSFITSTLSQLFYYTKDPSSPTGLKKEYKLVTRVLSSCISIQRNLEQVGITRQLYTFACNRIVTLYIECIRKNRKERLTYTSDFNEDRVPWKDSVMNRPEPAIRMKTMKIIHEKNPYMMKLLDLLSFVRAARKGGNGNNTTTRRRTRRGCASRPRIRKSNTRRRR